MPTTTCSSRDLKENEAALWLFEQLQSSHSQPLGRSELTLAGADFGGEPHDPEKILKVLGGSQQAAYDFVCLLP
jgi:hypothetical protein